MNYCAFERHAPMDTITITVILAGAILIPYGLRYFNTIAGLLQIRLAVPHTEDVPLKSIPAHIRELHGKAITELESQGFSLLGASYNNDLFDTPDSHRWHLYYFNDAHDTCARLTSSYVSADAPGSEVTYYSFQNDGTAVVTMDCRSFIFPVPIPGVMLQDDYTKDIAKQWQLHRSRLPASDALTTFASRFDFYERLDSYHRDVFAHYEETGILYKGSDGHYRIPFKHTSRYADGIKSGLIRLAHAKHMRHAPQDPPPIEAEVDAHLMTSHYREDRTFPDRKTPLLLLFGTAIAFLGSFTLLFSWEFALSIIAVVMFHELGHLAGMRLFGYRNLHILFLPFLGAVASGTPRTVRQWQQIVVSFLGPVPGVLAGTVLLYIGMRDQYQWMTSLAIILLVVNYLNLLPIKPLDGGAIAEALIADRIPRLALVFSAVCIPAFLSLAYFLHEPVFWLLGGLAVFTFIYEYRSAQILSRVPVALRVASRGNVSRETLASWYRALRPTPLEPQPPDGEGERSGRDAKNPPDARRPRTLSFLEKFNVLKSLEDTLRREPVSTTTSALTMIFFALIWIGPAAGFIQYMFVSNDAVMISRLAQPLHLNVDWDETIASARNDDEILVAAKSAAREMWDLGDRQEARRYLAMARESALRTWGRDARYADLLIYSAEHDDDVAESRSLLEESIDLLRKGAAEDRKPLADALYALVHTYDSDPEIPGVAQSYMTEYVQIYEDLAQRNPRDRSSLAFGQLELGHLLENENSDRAEGYYQRVINADLYIQDAPIKDEAAMSLAVLYASRERFVEAEAVLRSWIRRAEYEDDPGTNYLLAEAYTDLAWVLVCQNRVDEAARLLNTNLGTRPKWLDSAEATPLRRDLAAINLMNAKPAEARHLLQQARFSDDRSLEPTSAERIVNLRQDLMTPPTGSAGERWAQTKHDLRRDALNKLSHK